MFGVGGLGARRLRNGDPRRERSGLAASSSRGAVLVHDRPHLRQHAAARRAASTTTRLRIQNMSMLSHPIRRRLRRSRAHVPSRARRGIGQRTDTVLLAPMQAVGVDLLAEPREVDGPVPPQCLRRRSGHGDPPRLRLLTTRSVRPGCIVVRSRCDASMEAPGRWTHRAGGQWRMRMRAFPTIVRVT
jgi:hypothetical protein